MTQPIYTEITASISELKKNSMAVVGAGEGFPIAVLNRNKPAFYCVPADVYEAMLERLEDQELARAGAAGAVQEKAETTTRQSPCPVRCLIRPSELLQDQIAQRGISVGL